MTPAPKPGLWSWTANPKAAGAACIAALLLALMLIGLELALGRSGRGLEFEDVPGFYAVAGVVAAMILAGAGIGLRALLVRSGEPEDGAATHPDGGGDDRQS